MTPSQHTIAHVGDPDSVFNIRTYVAHTVRFVTRHIAAYIPTRYGWIDGRPARERVGVRDALARAAGRFVVGCKGEKDCALLHDSTYFGRNYGIVTVDADDRVSIEVKDLNGDTQLAMRLQLGRPFEPGKCAIIGERSSWLTVLCGDLLVFQKIVTVFCMRVRVFGVSFRLCMCIFVPQISMRMKRRRS